MSSPAASVARPNRAGGVDDLLLASCLFLLSSSAIRDSSNDAVADWHVVRHYARSNGAVLSDLDRRPHLFMLVLTVSL